MNICSLVGHVARAPAVRFEPEGIVQVCTFTLMIDERSYGPARKDYTLFVPCTSYGRVAEACSTLQAQDMVAITGRLTWRPHTHKCGEQHSQLCVRVQDVAVLEPAAAVA